MWRGPSRFNWLQVSHHRALNTTFFLLLQTWFQNCAFLLQRMHYVSTFSTGPPKDSHLNFHPPLLLSIFIYLYYCTTTCTTFSTRICRSLLRKCILGKRFCCHHHHHQHEVTASQRQGVQTKELRKGVRMSRSSKPAPSSKPSWC